MTSINLKSIHVNVVNAEGEALKTKRPIRFYDQDTFGVVVEGVVHPTKIVNAETVRIVNGSPKAKEDCPNAKVADLAKIGLTAAATAKPSRKSAKPVTMTIAEALAMLAEQGITLTR